jgi:hypothetical protein
VRGGGRALEPLGPHRLEAFALVAGIILAAVALACVAPRPRGRGGFILDIDDGLPWSGALAVAGAILVGLATLGLPRAWTRGPAVVIVLLVITLASIGISISRVYWPGVWVEHVVGFVGLGLAALIYVALIVRSIVTGVRARRAAAED